MNELPHSKESIAATPGSPITGSKDLGTILRSVSSWMRRLGSFLILGSLASTAVSFLRDVPRRFDFAVLLVSLVLASAACVVGALLIRAGGKTRLMARSPGLEETCEALRSWRWFLRIATALYLALFMSWLAGLLVSLRSIGLGEHVP